MEKQSALGEPHIHRTCGFFFLSILQFHIKMESLLYSSIKKYQSHLQPGFGFVQTLLVISMLTRFSCNVR